MQSNKNKPFIIAIVLVLVAILTRLIPHYPNFTGLGGIALFSSIFFSRKYLALALPLAALFVSDLLLNNLFYARLYPEHFGGFTLFAKGSGWVYLGTAAIVLIGFMLLKKMNVQRFVLGALISSIVFFLITNFGTWAGPWAMFPKTGAGLLSTYIAGIPYFWSTVAGHLFYGALLFGAYELLLRGNHFVSSTSNDLATNLPSTKK